MALQKKKIDRLAEEAAETRRAEALAEGTRVEGRGDTAVCSGKVEARITSLETAVRFFDVDLSEWEVDRWVCNKWEVGAKDADGEIQVAPLYQVKLWLKRRKGVRELREVLEEVVTDYRKRAPRRPGARLARRPAKGGGLAVISIPDLHLGKYCWPDETGGEAYDVRAAGEVFAAAVRNLAEKLEGRRVEKILFPFGNDFLNSNNALGQTARGTPQDEDGRWQRTYVKGFAVAEEAIAWLAENVAPVDVTVVRGNHDEERVFYLGHALEVAFRRHPRVTVDNAPVRRKYYRHGKTLLGLTHGDREKPEKLPLLMAAQEHEAWHATAGGAREWLLGHLHHRRGRWFETESEDGPVMVRWCPSLAPPDAWHAEEGYVGAQRAAELLYYGPSGKLEEMGYYYP